MDLFDGINNRIFKNRKSEKELELEFESVYGVPYGEYTLDANKNIINSKEYRNKFYGLTRNHNIDNIICDYARKAVLENSGTYKESMYLIDANTGDLIASIEKDEDKIESGVAYTDNFIKNLVYAHENCIPIIAIHNHPIGTPPSLDDISKIAENHYYIAIVAGTNGQVYRYYNPDNITFPREMCEQVHYDIAQNIGFGYDVDRAFSEAFEQLNVSYDILGGELYEK